MSMVSVDRSAEPTEPVGVLLVMESDVIGCRTCASLGWGGDRPRSSRPADERSLRDQLISAESGGANRRRGPNHSTQRRPGRHPGLYDIDRVVLMPKHQTAGRGASWPRLGGHCQLAASCRSLCVWSAIPVGLAVTGRPDAAVLDSGGPLIAIP